MMMFRKEELRSNSYADCPKSDINLNQTMVLGEHCDEINLGYNDTPPMEFQVTSLTAIGVRTVLKNIEKLIHKLTIDMEEGDRWFEQVQSQTDNLGEELRKLYQSINVNSVAPQIDMASGGEQLGKALSILATCEESTPLSKALSDLTDVTKNVSTVREKQAEMDNSKFSESIHEYIMLIGSLKDVFSERQRAWQLWQDAKMTLTRKREVKTKIELFDGGRSKKTEQLDVEIKQSTKEMDQLGYDFEDLSKAIREEVVRFDAEKAQDMKAMLIEYMESMIQTHTETEMPCQQHSPSDSLKPKQIFEQKHPTVLNYAKTESVNERVARMSAAEIEQCNKFYEAQLEAARKLKKASVLRAISSYPAKNSTISSSTGTKGGQSASFNNQELELEKTRQAEDERTEESIVHVHHSDDVILEDTFTPPAGLQVKGNGNPKNSNPAVIKSIDMGDTYTPPAKLQFNGDGNLNYVTPAIINSIDNHQDKTVDNYGQISPAPAQFLLTEFEKRSDGMNAYMVYKLGQNCNEINLRDTDTPPSELQANGDGLPENSNPAVINSIDDHQVQNLDSDLYAQISPAPAQSFFKVTIQECEKRGDGINAYMVYKLETEVRGVSGFTKESYSTWRRFSDFVELYGKMDDKYTTKGIDVPAPHGNNFSAGPAKTKMVPVMSQEAGILRARQLESYISGLVEHLCMRDDCDVRDFLTIEEDLPKAVQTDALSTRGMRQMLEKILEEISKVEFETEDGKTYSFVDACEHSIILSRTRSYLTGETTSFPDLHETCFPAIQVLVQGLDKLNELRRLLGTESEIAENQLQKNQLFFATQVKKLADIYQNISLVYAFDSSANRRKTLYTLRHSCEMRESAYHQWNKLKADLRDLEKQVVLSTDEVKFIQSYQCVLKQLEWEIEQESSWIVQESGKIESAMVVRLAELIINFLLGALDDAKVSRLKAIRKSKFPLPPAVDLRGKKIQKMQLPPPSKTSRCDWKKFEPCFKATPAPRGL